MLEIAFINYPFVIICLLLFNRHTCLALRLAEVVGSLSVLWRSHMGTSPMALADEGMSNFRIFIYLVASFGKSEPWYSIEGLKLINKTLQTPLNFFIKEAFEILLYCLLFTFIISIDQCLLLAMTLNVWLWFEFLYSWLIIWNF